MDIVSNSQELVSSSTARREGVLEVILGVLNLIGCNVVIIYQQSETIRVSVGRRRTISVQIEVGDNVTEIGHILLTTRPWRAGRVGRAHVCWKFPNDVV